MSDRWHAGLLGYEWKEIQCDAGVYLVSAADKLHNLRSMVSDYGEVGEELWSRFNCTKKENLENYAGLIAIYEGEPTDPRRRPIVRELTALLNELRNDL